jgi:hypothetical protein
MTNSDQQYSTMTKGKKGQNRQTVISNTAQWPREKRCNCSMFWDRSRNRRHLINYRHCLRSLPNRHLTSFWCKQTWNLSHVHDPPTQTCTYICKYHMFGLLTFYSVPMNSSIYFNKSIHVDLKFSAHDSFLE